MASSSSANKDLDDLLHPKDYRISRRKCWGCKIPEKKGELHKNCTKCVEKGYALPACFCSEECLKEYWLPHKEWHAAFDISAGKLSGGDTDAARYDGGTDEYSKLLSTSYKKFCKDRDIAGATKLLKKAIKVDPRRPEAYMEMGICFEESYNYGDCVEYFEKAGEKFAIALLMNRLGDKRLVRSEKLSFQKQWSMVVSILTRSYSDRSGTYIPKDPEAVALPDWYHEGPSLRRVTRYAMDIYEQQKMDDLSTPYFDTVVARALAMVPSRARKVKHGLYPTNAPIGLISEQEWKDAVNLFLLASKTPIKQKSDDMKSKARDILEFLKTSPDFIEIECRHMTAGLWVTVHGLQSAAGSKLNGKLGRITNHQRQNGRVPVQVGGAGNEPKLLKPQNLQEVDWPDSTFALLAWLQEQSQWAYMTTKFGPEAFC